MTVGKQKRPRSQEIVVKDDVTPTPSNPPPVINIPPPLPSIIIEDEMPGLYTGMHFLCAPLPHGDCN